MQIRWKDNLVWFLTTVYGSPALLLQRVVWQELRDISRNTEDGWVEASDFNIVIYQHETLRGDLLRFP